VIEEKYLRDSGVEKKIIIDDVSGHKNR